VLRVLVVDNRGQESAAVVRDLQRNRYQPEHVPTGTAALRAWREVDLVLLSLELPDLDGLEVCRRIRSNADVPIITVTDKRTETDRVLGLQAGADHYLSRPLGIRELTARMAAVLWRHHQASGATDQAIARGRLRIDPAAREVRVDEAPVDLTRKEFDLLRLLAAQPDRVISRERMMATVWGTEWGADGRTIDTHVNSLRKKLGGRHWITTVRGVGYRLGDE